MAQSSLGVNLKEVDRQSENFPNRSPKLFIFCGALLLWSFAFALSSRLAPDKRVDGDDHGKRAGMKSAVEEESVQQAPPESASKDRPTDPKIVALKTKVSEHPDDIPARLDLASALMEAAERDPATVMDAVREFKAVLERDPKNRDALRSLAGLSIEVGMTDKAIQYYSVLRELDPRDQRIKIEYSLALIQAGRAKDALPLLDEGIEAEPNSFQLHFAKALALKLSGDVDGARASANAAAQLTDDETAKLHLKRFLGELDQGGPAGSAAPSEVTAQGGDNSGAGTLSVQPGLDRSPSGQAGSVKPSADGGEEQLSPATVVAGFFNKHPIIGPKVAAIRWPTLNKAQVLLRQFPVEAMPAQMKESLINRIKTHMAKLPGVISIELCDAQSERVLMTIDVGAASTGHGEMEGQGKNG